MKRDWKNVEALSFVRFDSSHHSVFLGENIHSEVTLGIGDISPDEIGVEIIVATADLHGNIRIEDLEPNIPQAPGGNDSALALVVKDRRIVQSGGTLYFFREDADAESGFVPEFTESEAQAALGEADHE